MQLMNLGGEPLAVAPETWVSIVNMFLDAERANIDAEVIKAILRDAGYLNSVIQEAEAQAKLVSLLLCQERDKKSYCTYDLAVMEPFLSAFQTQHNRFAVAVKSFREQVEPQHPIPGVRYKDPHSGWVVTVSRVEGNRVYFTIWEKEFYASVRGFLNHYAPTDEPETPSRFKESKP